MRIAVQAHINSLEQFVRGGRGRRQQPLSIRRKAANQAVYRLVVTDGPWVNVCQIDSFRDINLPAMVKGLLMPPGFVQRGEAALGKDETAGNVISLGRSGE